MLTFLGGTCRYDHDCYGQQKCCHVQVGKYRFQLGCRFPRYGYYKKWYYYFFIVIQKYILYLKYTYIFRKYMRLRKFSEFFISIYIFKKSRYLFTYYRLDFILALLLIEIIWGWNLDNRKGFGSNLVGFPVAILAKNSPVTGPSLKPEPK